MENHKKALELFNEINIDSYKNKSYITLDYFSQIIINDFRQMVKEYYGGLFSKKKTEKGKIKCIEEFVDELYKMNFLKDKTKEEAFHELLDFNRKFYDLQYKLHNNDGSLETLLYKHEQKSIMNNKIVFTSKCNNFIEFIKQNGIVTPVHRWKKKKKRITKGLKAKIWYKWYKFEDQGSCPITHCNNVIYKTNYEAGHILSEYNGGLVELANLRPICKNCNLQMGSQNWTDFDNC